MANADGPIILYNCRWYAYTGTMGVASGKIELSKERIELASAVHHVVEAIHPKCERMDHELALVLPPENPLSANSCIRTRKRRKVASDAFLFLRW